MTGIRCLVAFILIVIAVSLCIAGPLYTKVQADRLAYERSHYCPPDPHECD